MADILLATDADHLLDEVDAALAGTHVVHRIRRGADVLAAVETVDPDLVLLDLQIGNMGGVAASLALRQEEDMGRLERRPVLLLCDRAADVWLARHSGADGWLIKPLDALRLAAAVEGALAGEARREEPALP